MKNYVQPGKNLEFEAAAAVSSGDVVVVEDLIGVATGDAAIGETVVLSVEGVFELPKDGNAITAGKKVYWHEASGHIQEASSGGKACGFAVESKLAGDAKVKVLLHKF